MQRVNAVIDDKTNKKERISKIRSFLWYLANSKDGTAYARWLAYYGLKIWVARTACCQP